VIPDGSQGALAELERRKFTAEEGVRLFYLKVLLLTGHPGPSYTSQRLAFRPFYLQQSALTYLIAYNAFTKYGKSSSWCKAHALNFRAMSRAVSIRSQLKKYMQRFGLPLQSCEGDAKRLRQCLVSGYWRNCAKWMADGTYRSVKGDKVGFKTFAMRPVLMLFA